jgi:8-oxo-dGTP diphosphatase
LPDKPYSLSVKVIVLDEEDRCLLLKRSADSKANAGKWDFPGGKLNPGETLHEALVREVREETGLNVEVVRVAGAAESESPLRRIAYLVMEARADGNSVRISEEHDDYRWVWRSELPQVDLCRQFRSFAAEYAAHHS